MSMSIAVLDDAPSSLGMSTVRAPFSRKWSLASTSAQIVVSSTAQFLRELPPGPVRRRPERLLLLSEHLARPTLDTMEHMFSAVVIAEPSPDLAQILRADNRDELLVHAAFDPSGERIVLHRGDLSTLVVPLSWFTPTGTGVAPDPERLRITDVGQTLALGEYEAAAAAILYEFDPAYRRRAKKRSIATDASFGGALRRLRLNRGLPRSAFEPAVAAKTVARIENHEIGKPRGKTLLAIAKKLGVRPEAIATY